MYLQNRGLLDGLTDTLGNVVEDVGNGAKSILKPLVNAPAPAPTPKPTPKPTQSNPTPPKTTSNPGKGSGNQSGNGSGQSSSPGSSSPPGNSNGNGNGNGSQPLPSSPPAGNPAQPPSQSQPSTGSNAAPPFTPSDGGANNNDSNSPSGPGITQPPSEPVKNVGSDPSESSGKPGQQDNRSGNSASLPTDVNGIPFSSFVTSGTSVFGVSGSSTVHIEASSPTGHLPTSTSPDDVNNQNSPVNAPSNHKGLPPVAIGLISAAVILIALFVSVFVVRRVYQRRRADRRTRWAPVMAQSTQPDGPSRSSVRSSFATTFDYGLRAQSPIPGSPSEAPALPPLTHLPESRRSSNGSDHSQWLMVSKPVDNTNSQEDFLAATPLTPLSVAPFTPTESFKFPQPPRSAQEPDERNPSSHYDIEPNSPLLQRTQTQHTEKSVYSRPSLGEEPAKPVLKSGLSAVIKRPFAPSLPDELHVAPGQVVTIEQIFDDGWSLVRDQEGKRGLVPLACFEDTDGQLTATDNSKRRSSLIEFTA